VGTFRSAPRILAAAVLVVGIFSTASAQDVRDTIGPLEQSATASSPENPVPLRIAFTAPTQLPEVVQINGVISVWLRVTLDGSGRVAEIRNFNGPAVVPAAGTVFDETLRKPAADAALSAAVAAVRQWRFEAPRAPIVFVVLVNFSSERAPTTTQYGGKAPVIELPPKTSWPAAERVGAVRPEAGNGVTPPKLLKSPTPRYTPEAMRAKIQGVVTLEVLIGTDGKVQDARVLQTPSPLLNQPAIDAARRWEFTPTVVNGEPKPIVVMLHLDFNLR
jgi:TonB family protein